MLRLLATLWKWLVSQFVQAPVSDRDPFRPDALAIPRYARAGDIPPLHWRACHPSTIKRFKAEMTCSRGHHLVLKGHSIMDDGQVSPSVVCSHAGCNFHTFVRLEEWDFGRL